MTARRALLLAALLAVVSVSAWGQVLNITPTSFKVFVVGQTIPLQQLTTQFPNDPTDWSVSSGSLPPSLNLDTVAGVISGTPTQAGAFTFTVSALDFSNDFTGTRQYTIYVSTGLPLTLTPITPAPPGGAVGSNYSSFTFQVSGGVPGYTWALQSGTNSDGLTLNASSGLLSGIPQAGGVFPIGITVNDASGVPVSASFNLNVLGITTPSLPAGAIAVPYSQTLTLVGATGPVAWSLSGTGPLPPGLNLSAQGQIAGTPTVLGAYPFQVNVTDTASKLTATRSFRISIASILTVTTTSPLPNGAVGVAYSQQLQATGGTAPYSWSATGLPANLALDSKTGIISGAPTAGGTSTISVTVTDAANITATASLSLTVGTFTISPSTLPNGVVGIPYPATSLTVAGAPVLNWAVTTGTLPAGLAVDSSTGVIDGKPTAAGSSPFTITATLGDRTSIGPSVVQAFTLVINAPPSATISGLPATGVAGTQPSASVSLGGTYPLNITGTMTLTFAPASGGSQLYDAKFASGPPTTATFTIPAGASQGSFSTTPFTSAPVMIGTVAGNITVVTTLQDSAGNPLPQPAPAVINVNATVPVITKVTVGAMTPSGFSISATGYSTPRDMTSALFHFTSPTNAQLASADVTVPLTSAFTSWYGSAASNSSGSQFTMTVQFTFTAPPGTTVPFTAVTLTLTNSKGTSTPFGPVNP